MLRTFLWVSLVTKYVGIALYVVGIIVHGFGSDLSEDPGLVAALGSVFVMAYHRQQAQDAGVDFGLRETVALVLAVIAFGVVSAHSWYETAIWTGIVGTTVVGLLYKRAVEHASPSPGLPSDQPR